MVAAVVRKRCLRSRATPKKVEPALRPAPLRLSHQDYSSWSWSFLPGERRADEAEEAVGSFIGTRALVAAIALKKISIRPRKVRPIRRSNPEGLSSGCRKPGSMGDSRRW